MINRQVYTLQIPSIYDKKLRLYQQKSTIDTRDSLLNPVDSLVGNILEPDQII